MLVSSSAFINYLIVKADKAGLKLKWEWRTDFKNDKMLEILIAHLL
jgi:hypothetical protein